MSNASNLSTLANVLDDGSDGQFLKSTGSGGVAFDTVAAGAVVYATADLLPLSGFAAGDMAYVTATNRFYINNGSGWYSISLVNTNPNITSAQDAGSNTTPFTLATDGTTATVVTVTAADPEDVPLTYGYSVTSGSLNGSTVVQGTGSNTNVFTVTPHASQAATFTITFTASDGINQATSANVFSLSFVNYVTDSNHTALLATATGTSDNNNITDSSSNSYTITAYGDVSAGTFSPHRSGGYSTYFDGTGDHIHFVDNSLAEGTDDFTLECYFYLTADLQQNHTIFGHGATPGYQICANAVNQINFMKDGSNRLLTTATLNLNQWYHIVYQRASGTLYGFLDGVSLGTISMTDNFTNTGIEVGVNRGGTEYFEGYIRDVRIVKGTTIYNTSETTFTPPTEGLVAVSGSGYSTTLLTCHKPYITDGGANSISPTIYNDVCIKPFSPYDYEEYDAADNFGSVYFDGSGDYLKHQFPALGTGDFEISCWIYVSTLDFKFIFDYRFGATNNPFAATLANGKIRVYTEADILIDSAAGVISAGQWYYIAYKRVSGTSNLYVNGSSVGSATDTTSFASVTNGYVGRRYDVSSYMWDGYISDFRIITSPTSSGYAIPTAPLSSSGTSLHIKGTDASVIDKSQGTNLKMLGNTTGSTTTKFTGAKSMYFDGTGDYLVVPASSEINFGTADFTIEFWINFAAFPSNGYILNKEDSSGNDFTLQYYQNAIKTSNATVGSGWNHYSSGIGSLSTGTWYHIAYCRSSGTLKSYKDGTQINSATDSRNYNLNNAITLGSRYPGDYAANIYVQDLRITKGLARYTASDETANIPSAPLEG